jgi:hypothetical protein
MEEAPRGSEGTGTIALGEVFVDSAKAFARLFFFFVAAALTPIGLVSAFSCCFCVVGAVSLGIMDPHHGRENGRTFGAVLFIVAGALLALLSFVQFAMQTRAVVALERGQTVRFWDELRALPKVLGSYAPVGILFGFAYTVGTIFCVLPGVVVAGLFELVPVAAADGLDPVEAFTRGRALASRIGVLAFVPSAIHAVVQFAILIAFAVFASKLDGSGSPHIAIILVVEGAFAIVAWAAFTYFAVVIPAVMYARLTARPADDLEGLAEVFR